jgi:hypothetical protein
MIKTSVTGRIFKILFSDKFSKRTIVIETKEQYNQHVSIDFINTRMELLNPIKEGQTVTVFVDVYSRPSASNPDKYFNNITGWKIEHESDNFVPEMDDVPRSKSGRYGLRTSVLS